MTSIKTLEDIYFFISRKSNDKYYVFKLAGLLFLLSCFFSVPYVFFFFLKDTLPSAWNTVILKSNDLTNNLNHIEPYSWQAKKVFRLSIPLLMKVFNLPPLIIVTFQILAGYLIFIFSYKLAFRISKDSVQSTFFTAGIAFLYFGKAAFFECQFTWFDGFSYFFIIMAMWSRNIVGIILFSSLVAWNDERGFIALSLVFLFHYFENIDSKKITFRELFTFNKYVVAVIASILLYILVRLTISSLYNMHTTNDGANLSLIVHRTWYFIPIGLLTFFEGFYFLLGLFFLLIFKNKDFLRLILIGISLMIMTIVSFCVTDITRSGSFAFPIVFIAIQYLKDKVTNQEMRVALLICLMVSVLIPPAFISADWTIIGMLPQNSIFFILDHLNDVIKHNF